MARHSIDPAEEKNSIKTLAEITTSGNPEIEVFDDMSSAELEAFMHEYVDVYMHPPRSDGELQVQNIPVNGVNQPFIKGKRMRVKRKYIEAAARTHSIKYQQAVPDGNRPDLIQMMERKIPSYPFDVLHDTAKGKAWLEAIYNSV